VPTQQKEELEEDFAAEICPRHIPAALFNFFKATASGNRLPRTISKCANDFQLVKHKTCHHTCLATHKRKALLWVRAFIIKLYSAVLARLKKIELFLPR
jgi:hypothetical protein